MGGGTRMEGTGGQGDKDQHDEEARGSRMRRHVGPTLLVDGANYALCNPAFVTVRRRGVGI